ncbi:hypothetical protein HanRHA438_Chr14g0651101 [Helianthus annuus]|uniref:Plant viral-response family protein n=1 Tax=Helianthus annuus TaxID=4232 RepID=A0A251TU25_HELAN|nr:uncharacterized protein LOC110877555 [Helianthus annuus]KAF5768798.1 hypothetical protein HanXRQr2_Chr14g0640741 [Helianthus annuus]KAJ0463962.1 hypothetical protein HanHA300_Chr14g0521641 [Helianthus annuus]KAJ0468309.1 hypothetical protein HanIR_Chr14g0695171 [Helianthus annuus]KAJ0485462.1 hypothetical protein HanHA89_Chr14g0568601 [Helianthus annuus]KAJ0656015.1 hypothetical protein HanLR1_Chr14g0530991 [Helianthus annuus]
MSGFVYHAFTSSALMSLGLYHLICTTRNQLKSPRDYTTKPYHPFSYNHHQFTKHIQLYLIIICLFIAFIHQTVISFDSDPLVKGRSPVHHFTSLQSAGVISLFLILSTALLISETTNLLPFPPDLFFGTASALFFLQYSVSSSSASLQTSGLEAKCDSVSSTISALSAVLCIILACHPKLFVADVGLGASICLQGLWSLQTGLSLYVDAFIPDGCHKLLDVVNGVEGSTKCDLEDSKLRATAILDLMFVVHVLIVILILIVTYSVTAKVVGVRRFGTYEALPTSSGSAADNNHIQMKAMSGTQA